MVGNFGLKDCEASSDVNANFTSKDGVMLLLKNRKCFIWITFESKTREIWESNKTKEVSDVNSKKARTFGNISSKVLRILSVLLDIWNYEVLEKQYFPKI